MVSLSPIRGSSGKPYSYLIFIAFIFLKVVVLMNLLNGLAVSDTGSVGKPYSYLVFIAFIFLIVVVLMNLLNSITVSDTRLIR
jgi:hypothetical protein